MSQFSKRWVCIVASAMMAGLLSAARGPCSETRAPSVTNTIGIAFCGQLPNGALACGCGGVYTIFPQQKACVGENYDPCTPRPGNLSVSYGPGTCVVAFALPTMGLYACTPCSQNLATRVAIGGGGSC